jgi:putative ABC transport system ATP-binding protein
MTSTVPLIEISSVSRIFRTEEVETHALSGIDLRIESGEYIAISGPSGCGKSTLLAILGLLDVPTTGSYELRGRAVQSLPSRERARIRNREIGFVFQAFNLIGDLKVHENVALPLTYRSVSASERKERALLALERVGLTHRSNHYPWQLSGGQQQRVAVARAIAGRPSILLADEPTGNLDSGNAGTIMDLLRDLHRDGTTICLVTHDGRFAENAGRTVHLLDGLIVGEGSPAVGLPLAPGVPMPPRIQVQRSATP